MFNISLYIINYFYFETIVSVFLINNNIPVITSVLCLEDNWSRLKYLIYHYGKTCFWYDYRQSQGVLTCSSTTQELLAFLGVPVRPHRGDVFTSAQCSIIRNLYLHRKARALAISPISRYKGSRPVIPTGIPWGHNETRDIGVYSVAHLCLQVISCIESLFPGDATFLDKNYG